MIRLLLTLLSLVLAIPAAATPACHDAAPRVSASMPHHHAVPATPGTAAATHDCLGCIPPSDWIGPPLAARLLPAALRRVPAPVAQPLGMALKPTPPPPRLA